MSNSFLTKLFKHKEPNVLTNPEYESCPRCEANLTLQKGYSNVLPYWICKGCGEMLVNPDVDSYSGVTWFCDDCGAMLNIQDGFHEDCNEWQCAVCGCVNSLESDQVYESEEEYQAALKDPYKGLSDEEALRLSMYEDKSAIDKHPNIWIVRDRETGELCIRKLLSTYDISVYTYLMGHPVAHMPQIREFFETDNCLVVIEEYIAGRTVEDIMNTDQMTDDLAISVIRQLCSILEELHSLPKPIIHRDIKPSNIIVPPDSEVYLIDVNVAKWYDPAQTDDTRHLGTENYAAPEQAGYGLSASSLKSDVYGMGILLNVMLTGKFPKEEIPEGALGDIIKRCISLNADDRYSVTELVEALSEVE